MIRWCKCGGRVNSVGELENCKTGERFALFRCSKCEKEYRQKKRAPAQVQKQDEDYLTEADYQTWMRL